jgi:2TM domain
MAGDIRFETPAVGDRPGQQPNADERAWARKRIQRKHKFRGDLVAYVVINAFLVAVWATTGFGYFWPGWVLAGWGVALVLDGWNVYSRRAPANRGITEDDIDRELHRR